MPTRPQPGAGSTAQWGAVVEEPMRVAGRTASARGVEEELTGALGPRSGRPHRRPARDQDAPGDDADRAQAAA